MKKILATIISVFLLTDLAIAVPSISSASINGTSGIVSGNSFGTKSTAAPIKWDDFESGSNGSDLSGWTLSSNSGNKYKYSTFRKNGNLAGKGQFVSGNYSNIARIDFSGSQQIYIRAWQYIEHVNGQVTRNLKTFRGLNPDTNSTHGTPSVGSTLFYHNDNAIAFSYTSPDTSTGDEHYYSPCTKSGQWIMIEHYLKLGTVNVANGATWYKENCGFRVNKSNIVTYKTATVGSSFNRFILPFYVSHTGSPTQGGDYNIYVDDVYMDNTLQKVEIGNNSNYASCTKREIQIPTAWSGSSISFTVNQGALTNSDNPHVFVIDANGDASAGKSVQFGASSPSDTQPPTLVSITPDNGATGLTV